MGRETRKGCGKESFQYRHAKRGKKEKRGGKSVKKRRKNEEQEKEKERVTEEARR